MTHTELTVARFFARCIQELRPCLLVWFAHRCFLLRSLQVWHLDSPGMALAGQFRQRPAAALLAARACSPAFLSA